MTLRLTIFLLLLNPFCPELTGQRDAFPRAKIDSMLSMYAGGRPGYALGIVQDGNLVYTAGYGMANLDYDIPLSDSSAFYIGSMAKQFTTAALLILEGKGGIDLEAPVRRYLPEFPDYGSEITLNHLIHHTSGVRETNSLQLFRGIDRDFEEVFTTDDLIALILAQKELNFTPGTEYRYSSGGYAVLARIVERVSGKSLRAFLAERVFKPLGMDNTFVCDDHHEIVPNRAVSYWPTGEGTFERRSQVFDAYGDGGIITTVRDLARWDAAFYRGLPGVSDFADRMYRRGVLNSGDTLDYARALNVWTYRGQPVVQHNGGMLGFRVDLLRFPNQRTSVILLGNSAYLDPTGLGLRIADLLLADFLDQVSPPVPADLTPTVAVSTEALEHYPGYYWSDDMNQYRRISRSGDSLFLDSGNPANRRYLRPVAGNAFQLEDESSVLLHFGADPELTIDYGRLARPFRRFDPTPPREVEEITAYLGSYYSKELRTTYRLDRTDERLLLTIGDGRPRQLFPVPPGDNIVWNGREMVWIGFAELKFDLAKDGSVNGLSVGDGRVSGVWFEKMEE
jgi:CubicO group peptidase (beta-lactamase class C family)